MPITYELEQKDGLVLITAHGEYVGGEDVLSYTEAFVRELERLGAPAALLDHRDLIGEMDVIDNVQVATGYAEAIKNLKQVRVAVVTTTERMSSITFLETIAQNLGIVGFAFDDMEEALEWLKG